MHIQPETTRIHIATSERPIYTSKSGSTGPEIGRFDTTFLESEDKYSWHVGQGEKHTSRSTAWQHTWKLSQR